MDNKAPPRPPPPPPRLSPQESPTRTSLRPASTRPPLMHRNSTTGSLSPAKTEEALPEFNPRRARTASANSARDMNSSSDGMAPARSMQHYRSKSTRFREERGVDPLLIVSLERPDLEDEAETTLLGVLERRHVTFDNDPFSAAQPAHRRNRTYGGGIPDVTAANNSPATETARPNSAPEIPRPALLTRAATSNRSRRNIHNNMADDANNLGDYLGVEGNGVVLSDDPNNLTKSASSDSSVPYHSTEFSHSSASPTNRQQNHWNLIRRQPKSYSRRRISSGTADHSDSSSTIRERAFQVAMSMKNESINTYTSSEDEGEFSELLNRVEASRENEEGSKTTGGSKGRRLDSTEGNRDNWSRSTKSAETGSRSGVIREPTHHKSHQQVFMGISTPLGGGFGGQSNIDMLFQVAEHVQELCQIPEEDERDDINPSPRAAESIRSHGESIHSNTLASENANFLQQISDSHPDIPDYSDEIEGVQEADEDAEANEQTPLNKNSQSRQDLALKVKHHRTENSKLKSVNLWIDNLRRELAMLWVALDFRFIRMKIWDFFQYQVSCIIIPLLAIATFFFYQLGNPSLSFLPNDTAVSWWILFAIRSYLTLQLANITEYLLVDVMATRSTVTVRLFGPLVTLYIMNAKGWPFLLTVWGMWNFVLIHGDSDFYEHWFHFSSIEMLNPANGGDGIVDSELYTDLLLSMILAGVATSVKRTILALYLGKRVYIHYKPKLEKVMYDMLLLTEVADLANALEEYEVEKVESPQAVARNIPTNRFSIAKSTMDMVDFVKGGKSSNMDTSEDEGEQSEELERPSTIKSWNRLRSTSSDFEDNENASSSQGTGRMLETAKMHSVGSLSASEVLETKTFSAESLSDKGSELCGVGIDDDEDLPGANPYDNFLTEPSGTGPDLKDDSIHASEQEFDPTEPAAFHEGGISTAPIDMVEEPVRNILHQASTTTQIKSLLDRWEEPVNKRDKGTNPTIHEILQFRKALAYLDDEYPFGLSFGPASDRNSCINSARSLYSHLLAFDADTPLLHFDVIGVLAYEADGNFDEKKAKGLVRLFRPDKFDELTLLAFVQSCDYVYKRLRYLRASVGNSTSIDRVLEKIFNAIFGFFLFLTVLSIMKLNPWALLVSMSTVLVSFAFALGPTAAKFIEGMMMIAVRRPFDLGDRISICNPNDKSGDTDPSYDDTWLVEDCNLFTTTLRLARSNEIAYLNNGMLSNCKIVNHGRSINALVNLSVPMRIEATHEQIQIVKSSLEQYIQDNPRVWSSIVFWRIALVEPKLDVITYSLRVQHVRSWQDHASVMRDRGDLLKFCCEILLKLGIDYKGQTSMNEIYVKELPQNSYVANYLAGEHE